jgi:hypothetical protein
MKCFVEKIWVLGVKTMEKYQTSGHMDAYISERSES